MIDKKDNPSEENSLSYKIFLLSIIGFTLNFTTNFSIILSYSLFLSKLGSSYLAYYYITLNILAIIIGSILFIKNISGFRWLFILTPFMGIIFFILPTFFNINSPGIIYFTYTITGVFFIYSILFYSNFINQILTIREVKKSTGLLSAIGFLGIILSGLFTKPIITKFEIKSCFILTGIIYILTTIIMIIIAKFYKGEVKVKKEHIIFKDKGIYISELIKIIALFTIILGFTKYILDYQFSRVITETFSDQKDLAGFIGIFTSVSRIIIFFLQILFSEKILKVISISTTFKIIAISIIIFSFLSILYPEFWIIISFQFVILLLSKAIDLPARNVIMGAILNDVRAKIRFFIDGICYCSGVMLTGIIIAVLNNFSVTPRGFFIIIFITGFLYFLYTDKLNKAYIDSLMKNLKKYNETDYSLEEKSKNEIMKLMETEETSHVTTSISWHMNKFNKGILFYDELVKILNNQNEPLIIKKAIEFLATSGDKKFISSIFPYISNKDSDVKSVAILATLKLSNEFTYLESSVKELINMVKHRDGDIRIKGITILGELGLECFAPVIKNLLHDNEITVREHAIKASLKLRLSSLIEDLTEMRLKEENLEILEIINRAIEEIKNDTFDQILIITDSLNFEDKHKVINSIRSITDPSLINLLLKFFTIESKSLSVKFTELTGQYRNNIEIIQIFKDCFKKDFTILPLIIKTLSLQDTDSIFCNILKKLSDSGAKEIIFQEIIKLVNDENKSDDFTVMYFYICSLIELGQEKGMIVFENITSGDKYKIDMAIEIIESSIKDNKLTASLVKSLDRNII